MNGENDKVCVKKCRECDEHINQCSEIKDNIKKIPDERTLEKMSIEEQRRRSSQEYIDKCTEVKDEINGWLRITAEMQEDIVTSFGYDKSAVYYLRIATKLYPTNPIFKEVVYVKHNKARQGEFKINDDIKNAVLHDLNNETTTLFKLCDTKLPTIIFGSSAT